MSSTIPLINIIQSNPPHPNQSIPVPQDPQSKFRFSLPASVLSVRSSGKAPSSQPLLLFQDELFALDDFLLAAAKGFLLHLLFLVHLHLVHPLILNLFLLLHLLPCFSNRFNDTQIATHSCLKHQKILFGASTVGVVDDEATRKATFHGSSGDHLQLPFAVGVKLQDCPSPNAKTIVERLEKLAASLEGVVILATGNAEPLNSRNTDGTIKHSWSKFPSLTDVYLPKPALRVLLGSCDVEHVSADIYPLPDKLIRLQSFPRDAGPASNIKHE